MSIGKLLLKVHDSGANDVNRLNVLRGLLAETTNAAKTSSPIKTDIQVLSLLKKRASASRMATQQFRSAKREDLVDNEMAQIAVLEEYTSDIYVIGEEEITKAATDVIGKMRADGMNPNPGVVMKDLVKPGGELYGKPVEGAEVVRIIKGLL
ncbi:hypothetical protein MMC20_001921 [Loxospora ochrophaea]|nr:hypothetical protein [Loxospora ochrophaea]